MVGQMRRQSGWELVLEAPKEGFVLAGGRVGTEGSLYLISTAYLT